MGKLFRITSLAALFLLGSLFLTRGAHAQTAGAARLYLRDFGQAIVTSPTGALATSFVPPATSSFSNYVSRPRGFGPASAGEWHHYRVALADDVCGKLLRKLIIPAVSKERDIYVTDRQGAFYQRFMRASRHSLFSGSTKLNWSDLPGSAVAAAISDLYQPTAQKTWAGTLKRFGTNSAGYWIADEVWEFDLTCKARSCLKMIHLNCKRPSER